MNLCNDDHDEICFEGRKCPLCEMRADKDKEIEELVRKVDDLKDEIGSLSMDLETHNLHYAPPKPEPTIMQRLRRLITLE